MDDNQYTQALAKETMGKLLKFYSTSKGGAASFRLHCTLFINYFIQILIQHALKDFDTDVSRQVQHETVSHNFLDLKENLQEQIAFAFGRTLSQASDEDVNYFCLIKPLSDPVNIQPC